MPEESNPIANWLIPRYDESSLFLMSLAFLLLFFTDAGLRTGSSKFLFSESDLRSYLFALCFVLGMLFSLYHVFATTRKTGLEKVVMLFFAVMVNGFSGIAAGVHMLRNCPGVLMVFPVWNIVSGGLLLVMYRFNIIDESRIADEDAPPREVALGGLVVVAAFVLCRFVFRLYWAVTFSICVAYATHLNQAVQRLLPGPRGKGER